MICLESGCVCTIWQRWTWFDLRFLFRRWRVLSDPSGRTNLGLCQRCPQTTPVRGYLIRQCRPAVVIDISRWWSKLSGIFQGGQRAGHVFGAFASLSGLFALAHPSSLVSVSVSAASHGGVQRTHDLIDALEVASPGLFASILSFGMPPTFHHIAETTHGHYLPAAAG